MALNFGQSLGVSGNIKLTDVELVKVDIVHYKTRPIQEVYLLVDWKMDRYFI